MSTGNLPFESADRKISTDLALPENLRDMLAKPFGPLVEEKDVRSHLSDCTRSFAVGDMVNLLLASEGIHPDLVIFDLRTRRGPCADLGKIFEAIEGKEIEVTNPPGKLTADLWNAVADSMVRTGRTKIRVNGEEDLASLACVALGEPGDCVIYGIPDRGVTIVKITSEIKQVVNDLLERMHSDSK